MWSTMLPVAALVVVVSGIPCEEARLKCAYREGCGTALKHYLVGCSGVLQNPQFLNYCPQVCFNSLIVLVSTEEGKALMECECSDQYCSDQKRRTEVCRPSVMKTLSEPIVPCKIAQEICNADAECSMAFDYYWRYCKAMFHGKKCTPRCHNSINILRSRDKAQKLKMCKCEGSGEDNCHSIQRNMDKLCFHSTHHHYNTSEPKVHANDTPKVVTMSCGSRSVVSLFSVCFVTLLMLWTR